MNQKNIFFCITALTLQTILVFCEKDHRTPEKKFPDMFFMDNYYECSKHRDNAYCTAHMNLIPNDAKSDIWRDIEAYSRPRNHFNRTIIHRTLCIPSKYKDYLEKKVCFERKTNQELKVYNLTVEIFSIDCKREKHFGVDIRVFLIGTFIYLGLIVLATINDQTHDKQSKSGKWLLCFSLTSNWKKLTGTKNQDFERLKCMQGIRTYQTMIVISGHTALANCHLHIQNPSIVEEMLMEPVGRIMLTLFMFVIQTYFVISTWLLTNQVLEMSKNNGRFSVRDGLVLFLHRVARFWAPLLVMMFIGVYLYVNFANGPGNFESVNIFCRTCSKNWWATLFLVTNFLDIAEVCNLAKWSLSVDTQYHIICIAFLYIVLNYQLDIKKCLACLFIFTYVVNVAGYYQEELPLLANIDAKTIKPLDFYHSKTLTIGYFGFWINTSSSLIGILFGYLYFLCKEDNQAQPLEKLCGPIFAIVPLTVVLASFLDTGKLVTILLGPMLKPLYGFGIACGVYGMSRNVIRGWVKSICENKYAVLLGNFTFGTYFCHFLVVFANGAKSTSLVELSRTGLVISAGMDIVMSFALGIGFALLIEQPAVNIKNMILPQIRRKTEPSKEQSNGYKNNHKYN